MRWPRELEHVLDAGHPLMMVGMGSVRLLVREGRPGDVRKRRRGHTLLVFFVQVRTMPNSTVTMVIVISTLFLLCGTGRLIEVFESFLHALCSGLALRVLRRSIELYKPWSRQSATSRPLWRRGYSTFLAGLPCTPEPEHQA